MAALSGPAAPTLAGGTRGDLKTNLVRLLAYQVRSSLAPTSRSAHVYLHLEMAPTISEYSDYRPTTYSLEEQLHAVLRLTPLNEGVRNRRSPHKSFRLNSTKFHKIMGLVVDQDVREGDSPGLPSSNTSIEEDIRRTGGYEKSKKADLIDITLKTMALLRRNQLLQKRLTALQMETRAFVKSALNSPQNGHRMSIDK